MYMDIYERRDNYNITIGEFLMRTGETGHEIPDKNLIFFRIVVNWEFGESGRDWKSSDSGNYLKFQL